MSKPESKAYGSRLKEITEVLHKHGITRGVTPEKLRLILEDLGPTFIKLGQIMSLKFSGRAFMKRWPGISVCFTRR